MQQRVPEEPAPVTNDGKVFLLLMDDYHHRQHDALGIEHRLSEGAQRDLRHERQRLSGTKDSRLN